MYRLFVAKTENEEQLVQIIKTSQDLKARRKALLELRFLCGVPKDECGKMLGLVTIKTREVYQKIKNNNWYCQKFSHAIIEYEDTMIKR
jgi:DNA-directed RNA polymerase specialized sigma subunit